MASLGWKELIVRAPYTVKQICATACCTAHSGSRLALINMLEVMSTSVYKGLDPFTYLTLSAPRLYGCTVQGETISLHELKSFGKCHIENMSKDASILQSAFLTHITFYSIISVVTDILYKLLPAFSACSCM
jgi:hypothetical protein